MKQAHTTFLELEKVGHFGMFRMNYRFDFQNFHRRLLWALIFMWDGNLFRFLVKTIHASNVGRSENGNLVIGHIQYVGPESMAARYSYQVCKHALFVKVV